MGSSVYESRYMLRGAAICVGARRGGSESGFRGDRRVETACRAAWEYAAVWHTHESGLACSPRHMFGQNAWRGNGARGNDVHSQSCDRHHCASFDPARRSAQCRRCSRSWFPQIGRWRRVVSPHGIRVPILKVIVKFCDGAPCGERGLFLQSAFISIVRLPENCFL
jgi:hypothetical protein